MSEQLGQSVMDVIGKSGGVMGATSVTWAAAIANGFEAVQPIIGVLVSCGLLAITYGLSRKRARLLSKEIELRDKNIKLRDKDIELRDAQIKAMDERKEDRDENVSRD